MAQFQFPLMALQYVYKLNHIKGFINKNTAKTLKKWHFFKNSFLSGSGNCLIIVTVSKFWCCVIHFISMLQLHKLNKPIHIQGCIPKSMVKTLTNQYFASRIYFNFRSCSFSLWIVFCVCQSLDWPFLPQLAKMTGSAFTLGRQLLLLFLLFTCLNTFQPATDLITRLVMFHIICSNDI